MTYRIRFAPRAERDLKSLQKQTYSQIIRKIDALAENPLPDGVKKLTGNEKLFRIRVGDHRIVYTIEKGELIVLIITIRHRREVYRR
jgi:mRNA interferase RelE/StbE